MGRIVYYIAAVGFGLLVSLLIVGTSVRTMYLLDGRVVNSQMTSPEFLEANLLKLKTKTVIDYDGLLTQLAGRSISVFPHLAIDGDIGTPYRVKMTILVLHTSLVVFVLWLIRRAITRGRSNSPLSRDAPQSGGTPVS